ncbi:AraC family transcriptional regulator [Fluviicola sp.]|uniref:helix-turn-helix domain-containing protein n=1 Tax=Fluviicola sp. TaxID=1917219 RepID=UPI0031DD6ABE
MTNPSEIIPGVIFYNYLTGYLKEKAGFWEHSTLVLLVSGKFVLETSTQKIGLKKGEMLLIRKNQLGQISKFPLPGEHYQTIVISLQEEFLRQIALEEQLEIQEKYEGELSVRIPSTEFLKGYFQSILPYVSDSSQSMSTEMGMLKIKEVVKLLLHTMPSLRAFLFDFSEQHKIDLEKFMLSNFHFNIPVERFAQLSGRSLASFKRDFQKTFGMPPRQWLLEKRLSEARYLIEKKQLKPSEIYAELGFETFSHFSHAFRKKFGKAPSEFKPVVTG